MKKLEVVNELISDHWQIRDLLKEMRDQKLSVESKHALLKPLENWMTNHSEGERQTVDQYGKSKKALKVLAYEDEEEHSAIQEIFAKLHRHSKNPDLWNARLHLLCELIEHHLDEEEEEFFPQLRQEIGAEESDLLARRYRHLTASMDSFRPKPRPGLLGWLSARPEPGDLDTAKLQN